MSVTVDDIWIITFTRTNFYENLPIVFEILRRFHTKSTPPLTVRTFLEVNFDKKKIIFINTCVHFVHTCHFLLGRRYSEKKSRYQNAVFLIKFLTKSLLR